MRSEQLRACEAYAAELAAEVDRLRARIADMTEVLIDDMTEVLEEIQGRLESDPTLWPGIKGRIDDLLKRAEP